MGLIRKTPLPKGKKQILIMVSEELRTEIKEMAIAEDRTMVSLIKKMVETYKDSNSK